MGFVSLQSLFGIQCKLYGENYVFQGSMGWGGYLSKGRVVVVDVGGGNQLRIIFQHRIDCVCMCVVGRGGRF